MARTKASVKKEKKAKKDQGSKVKKAQSKGKRKHSKGDDDESEKKVATVTVKVKKTKSKEPEEKDEDSEATESEGEGEDEEEQEEKPKKKRSRRYTKTRSNVRILQANDQPILPKLCFKRMVERVLNDGITPLVNDKHPYRTRAKAVDAMAVRVEGKLDEALQYAPGIMFMHQRSKPVKGSHGKRHKLQPEVTFQVRHLNMIRAFFNKNPRYSFYGNKPAPCGPVVIEKK